MRAAAAGLLVLLALLAPTAAARAATPRTSLPDVADEVMCVSCNVPLFIAESPQADQERTEIRGLIRRGLTKQQIKARLVQIYGPNVLAQPKGDGFDLLAWVVPIAAAVGLLGLGLLLIPRWRRRPAPDDPGADPRGGDPDLDPVDARRLDRELAGFDA